MKKSGELVFIPCPVVGHLVPILELAKLLVRRDAGLSITVIFISHPSEHIELPSSSQKIRFVNLPPLPYEPSPTAPFLFFHSLLQKQKPHVNEVVQQLLLSNAAADSSPLAGFVVDTVCAPMIDVANDLGVPSYIFYTSGLQALSLCLHVVDLQDERNEDPSELIASDCELDVPGLINAVPAKFLPDFFENKDVAAIFLGHLRKLREVKGIVVNGFAELESYTLDSLSSAKLPPLYPVGPMLKLAAGPSDTRKDPSISWLDDQPPSSVVFLCFGSLGSFHEEQTKEIAFALERSGHRFLWSLRLKESTGSYAMPHHVDPAAVLPDGFLDRTAKVGRVVGWAPQVDVLAHPAVGGFVSHCGWNSILESIWAGVPMVTWPLYAEQRFNAFSILKEFNLAVEIKMDCRKKSMTEEQITVSSEEIERGIRGVLQLEDEKRKKVKEMSEKCRRALQEGGSSFTYLGRFIDDMLKNMP